MVDSASYLEDKKAQINNWIDRFARLDALCREADDDVRIKFEIQLKEFIQNLDELNDMFREFQGLNEYGREKFRQIIEKNWSRLEENFQSSISEYEHLIQVNKEE